MKAQTNKFFNEMKEAHERGEKFSQGEWSAYHAWKHSLESGLDYIEMTDFLWDREVEDFVAILRRADVKYFVYTNKSTAVMDNLFGFKFFGCKVSGLYERYDEFHKENVRGIMIKL